MSSATVSQVISSPGPLPSRVWCWWWEWGFLLAHSIGLWVWFFYHNVLLLYFTIANVRFHIHEISYTLDTSFLFSLLTLKSVYPVLRTAFLQLTIDNLFTAGYSMPVILHSLSLLAKASTTVPFLYTTSFCYGQKYFVLHKRTAC